MTSLTMPVEPTTMVLGGVLALAFLWWLSTRRPKDLPPGPGPALPLLGHLHLLSVDPRKQFAAWRRKYGDIFCLYLGGRPLIVLNGFNVIKEALVKNADAFSERPQMFFTKIICENKGVLATSGTVWKEQRKVTQEILREMGVGKNILAEKIQDEVSQYIEAVATYKGEAFDLGELIHTSISNNICSIVFGKRFEYDDPVFKRYLAKIVENVKSFGATSAINIFPFLRHLPGDRFKANLILANVADIDNTFILPQLKKHLDEHTDDNASDFIHAYIREIRKYQSGGEATSINGRRICLGESLARMELFLYLTTMIQRFCFLPLEGEPLPSLEGILGITYSPKPFKVRALPRDVDTQ